MKQPSHTTADASHYDAAAATYDILNEENSRILNETVASLLKEYAVSSVLDMTCGTGAQLFYLVQQGYTVVGSDISASMLAVAQQKAKQEKLDVKLIEGDMRTVQVGAFDAVITMFNAIGHLAKDDFAIAMRNIHANLNDGGIYIFDINNLSYLAHDANITSLTIDWLKQEGDLTTRYVQYSTVNQNGVLASYTARFEQQGDSKPVVKESAQTLQIYTADQLKEMLHTNGFTVLKIVAIDGSSFDELQTDRMIVVAQKA